MRVRIRSLWTRLRIKDLPDTGAGKDLPDAGADKDQVDTDVDKDLVHTGAGKDLRMRILLFYLYRTVVVRSSQHPVCCDFCNNAQTN
jgi:hypothetical protein